MKEGNRSMSCSAKLLDPDFGSDKLYAIAILYFS